MESSGVMGTIVTFITSWGIRVVGVLFALWVANVIAKMLSRMLVNRLSERNFDATLTKFFGSLVRWAVLSAVIIGCLGVFGIDTTSFAAVIAAAGLAIGLALQGTLSHFASGVMLLIFRPIKVGDYVVAGGSAGTVVALDLFTTELKTPDNRRLVVPNGEIFGKTIENVTHYPIRRVDIPVGVSYDADIDRTRSVLEGCVANIPGVLEDPAHQIFLKELGASSVDWVIRVWAKTSEFWNVHQAGVRAAKQALDSAKLNIPYPQVDVHLDDQVVGALSQFSGRGTTGLGSGAAQPIA